MREIQFQGKTMKEWTVGPSRFVAWPEQGARLIAWDVSYGRDTKRDVIFWPEQADMTKSHTVRGGNPILFPFCGRTYCDGEMGFWRTPEGERRPMPMHGFARECAFAMEEMDERGFLGRMIPSPIVAESYPYPFEFRVRYAFGELSLVVTLSLKNLGTTPIPWSAGHHFYFTMPWHAGATRGDYRILLPAKKAFNRAADGSLAPVKDYAMPKPDAVFPLNDAGLLDRIHTHLQSNDIRFGPKNGEQDVRVIIGDAARPTPNTALVTWSESETAPFYCVEPWMGPPNSPSTKVGLHFVNPGETAEFVVKVSLE
ncbi:MAG: aldose epimerase [Verrucomicrobiota bacterium]|nr:aldose epimerase [Verrucomicrobiota bacterium]